LLRVTDIDSAADAFPNHLIATHLCATAEALKPEALRLLAVAIEVWPPGSAASDAPAGDAALNPNNFWAWADLGACLSDAGQTKNAIEHWRTAICLWPRGGKALAGTMLEREHARSSIKLASETLLTFWSSVSNDQIKLWCAEKGIDLSDAALT
jgi:tetratricopeptide (TPR) repeat protein